MSWRNLLVLTESPVQTNPRGPVMETGEHVSIHTQSGLDAAADASPSVHCIIFGGIPRGEHSFPDTSVTYSKWGCLHEGAEYSPWQPLAASNQGMPAQLASGQGPTPAQCSSTPLLAISVVMGTLSLGDAPAGGR